ncbi:hypothetical protein PCASD_02136 [Puccinia coronata f. sp. avenae]|uniref:Uncharacterized protein n=1 Tax=Puccinia coronata f. sp. avenae TaxID=200324 RepID=A0A2N5VPW4_9BASI|nr:hypothetical protein PCASD_02136 [Puccinia coronata f. sp. avenae]
MTWVYRAHQADTCASPASSEPADLLAGLLAELAQVPALQAGLPARRAGTSSASRSTCSPSCSTCSPSWYHPTKQVYQALSSTTKIFGLGLLRGEIKG